MNARSSGVMTDESHLWTQIHTAFEGHRQHTDPDAHTAFERVAQKCLFLSERRAFNSDNCTVVVESLSLEDLNELRVFHNRGNPKGDLAPIVIIEDGEDRVVIDGNNRVNLWRATGIPGSFESIIVRLVTNDT